MSITNVGWSVGDYCNASCNHCYSKKARDCGTGLTRKEIETVIEKLSKLGVKTLNLGGNEPIFTSGPDPHKTLLPQLIDLATEAGIVTGITTNGTTALYLARYQPDTFQMVNDWDFSLDSPFEEEHNINRGVPLFQDVLEGLQICNQNNVPKSIVMCAMNWNISPKHTLELIRLSRMFQAEIRINTLRPTEPFHYSLLPSPQQFFDFFRCLLDHTHTVVVNESIIASLAGFPATGSPCGITSMRIQPKKGNGTISVSPCIYLHELETGDLLRDDVFDIVNSPNFVKIQERVLNLPQRCKEMACELLDACRGGCSARAKLIRGSFQDIDPYCPQEFQLAGNTFPEFEQRPLHTCSGIRVHENYLCTWIGIPRKAQ